MKYKILIAEDEAIERRMLCQTLNEHLGEVCELLEAANGDQAMELYQRFRPEIVLLDIEMPGLSGLEVARRIRAGQKPCVILFLTGFDKFSYAKQTISVHAQEYLLKPYNEEELLSTVEEAVQLAAHFADGQRPTESAEVIAEPDEESVRLSMVREEIRACIEAHYAENLSMQDVARYMRYSEGYFCRLFKQCFRVNFSAYLNEYRIEKAKQMMRDTRKNMKDIGTACGYSDAAYFCRVFKRLTGLTPSEYRMAPNGWAVESRNETLTES